MAPTYVEIRHQGNPDHSRCDSCRISIWVGSIFHHHGNQPQIKVLHLSLKCLVSWQGFPKIPSGMREGFSGLPGPDEDPWSFITSKYYGPINLIIQLLKRVCVGIWPIPQTLITFWRETSLCQWHCRIKVQSAAQNGESLATSARWQSKFFGV